MRTWRSKALQWVKRDLWVKCALNAYLFQRFCGLTSRYSPYPNHFKIGNKNPRHFTLCITPLFKPPEHCSQNACHSPCPRQPQQLYHHPVDIIIHHKPSNCRPLIYKSPRAMHQLIRTKIHLSEILLQVDGNCWVCLLSPTNRQIT